MYFPLRGHMSCMVYIMVEGRTRALMIFSVVSDAWGSSSLSLGQLSRLLGSFSACPEYEHLPVFHGLRPQDSGKVSIQTIGLGDHPTFVVWVITLHLQKFAKQVHQAWSHHPLLGMGTREDQRRRAQPQLGLTMLHSQEVQLCPVGLAERSLSILSKEFLCLQCHSPFRNTLPRTRAWIGFQWSPLP